jgi:hypothetical protein
MKRMLKCNSCVQGTRNQNGSQFAASIATCTNIVDVIPLDAALQFWKPTMASFVKKVKKLSSLDIFQLNFHNKLIKRGKKNLKLQHHTATKW